MILQGRRRGQELDLSRAEPGLRRSIYRLFFFRSACVSPEGGGLKISEAGSSPLPEACAVSPLVTLAGEAFLLAGLLVVGFSRLADSSTWGGRMGGISSCERTGTNGSDRAVAKFDSGRDAGFAPSFSPPAELDSDLRFRSPLRRVSAFEADDACGEDSEGAEVISSAKGLVDGEVAAGDSGCATAEISSGWRPRKSV